ncbi:GAF and ANTAR domain-containing protein [Pseudonocardia sediminis]|uniref:GAF and ANTAR domain-containing protein n=1 Tax=Pseudonocardia sediminis TaxID=1397368 RepID=UPI001F5EB63B|nr:GAF and ANTAR domain-containing protein [Pseudonocardia sediminis]
MTTAFVGLADTLVDDYDVIDLLGRLAAHGVTLLGADAAGILLLDGDDRLRVAASTDEQTGWMELLQTEAGEGPCVECVRSGAPVSITAFADGAARWPQFVAALARGGTYAAVHALPLRLRERTIGALSLFHRVPGALPDADRALGQALADMATIGILTERAVRRGDDVTEQLDGTLADRVLIEQAKGVLAQRGDVGMDTAFDRLRRYARDHDRRLAEIAGEVVETALVADDVLARPKVPRRDR